MDYFLAQDMGVSVTYGWAISEIVQGGLADDAGVRAEDVLIGINGYQIYNGDGMSSYLEEETLPGQSVVLTIVRNNSQLDLTLVLGKRPPAPA